MKFSTVAKVWLWGLLAAISVMVTEATSNQLIFRPNEATIISIRLFNDGRPQPYRLVIKENNITLIYAFRFDGRLTSYKEREDNEGKDGDISKRFLVDYDEQTEEILGFIPTEVGMPTPQDLPPPFACDDCAVAWDGVCGYVDTFCGLLDGNTLFTFGPLCGDFTMTCDTRSAEEACSETCVI